MFVTGLEAAVTGWKIRFAAVIVQYMGSLGGYTFPVMY